MATGRIDTMGVERRALLGGVPLVVGLSGCVNSGGTTDLSISNETPAAITATVRVAEPATETQLLAETLEIAEGEIQEYEEVVSDADVDVYLDVRNGPTGTYEWFDGERDAEGLYIDVTADSITFSPLVR